MLISRIYQIKINQNNKNHHTRSTSSTILFETLQTVLAKTQQRHIFITCVAYINLWSCHWICFRLCFVTNPRSTHLLCLWNFAIPRLGLSVVFDKFLLKIALLIHIHICWVFDRSVCCMSIRCHIFRRRRNLLFFSSHFIVKRCFCSRPVPPLSLIFIP